jgi:hypoxanthine phosphoribosyltransferase
MRELIFNKGSVEDGLTQAYEEIKKAGYQQYILLGVRGGGEHITDMLSECCEFRDILSCEVSKSGSVTISDSSKIKNKNILICEDTVNTGKTIKKVIAELKQLGASDIKIFSLIMRRNCSIVPNIFVFEIENDTVVYLPWSNYPIRNYPKGIVRKIFVEDCNKTFGCKEPKINTALIDYYKSQQYYKAKVYLVEDKDEICAIIQFLEIEVNKCRGLYLDVVATAKGKEGHGYASTLLNLVTSYMHYHDFDFIYGFALDKPELIEMYKTKGYVVIGSIEDSNYGKLHKIITVHKKKDKEEVIAAIRKKI